MAQDPKMPKVDVPSWPDACLLPPTSLALVNETYFSATVNTVWLMHHIQFFQDVAGDYQAKCIRREPG